MKPTTGVVSFEQNLSFPVFCVYFLLGLGGDFPTFDTFFLSSFKDSSVGMRYVCVYLEPGDVLLFWSLNPPKQGPLFQSKQGARFAFQVCISKYIQTSICCLRYAKKGEMCCHCIPFSPIAIVDLQIYHTFCNHASKHSNMPPSTNPGPSTGYIYIHIRSTLINFQ